MTLWLRRPEIQIGAGGEWPKPRREPRQLAYTGTGGGYAGPNLATHTRTRWYPYPQPLQVVATLAMHYVGLIL